MLRGRYTQINTFMCSKYKYTIILKINPGFIYALNEQNIIVK